MQTVLMALAARKGFVFSIGCWKALLAIEHSKHPGHTDSDYGPSTKQKHASSVGCWKVLLVIKHSMHS